MCAWVVATRRSSAPAQVRMARRGGEQVGLEADVEEDARRCRTAPRAPGRAAVCAWMRASVAPTARANAGSAWPSRSASFQSGWSAGGRKLITSTPSARMLAEHARRAARLRRVGGLHPARLVAVALDRRAPVGGHAQLRQGALRADRTARGVDAPDVRRDAAGQRPTGERRMRRRCRVRAAPARTLPARRRRRKCPRQPSACRLRRSPPCRPPARPRPA